MADRKKWKKAIRWTPMRKAAKHDTRNKFEVEKTDESGSLPSSTSTSKHLNKGELTARRDAEFVAASSFSLIGWESSRPSTSTTTVTKTSSHNIKKEPEKPGVKVSSSTIKPHVAPVSKNPVSNPSTTEAKEDLQKGSSLKNVVVPRKRSFGVPKVKAISSKPYTPPVSRPMTASSVTAKASIKNGNTKKNIEGQAETSTSSAVSNLEPLNCDSHSKDGEASCKGKAPPTSSGAKKRPQCKKESVKIPPESEIREKVLLSHYLRSPPKVALNAIRELNRAESTLITSNPRESSSPSLYPLDPERIKEISRIQEQQNREKMMRERRNSDRLLMTTPQGHHTLNTPNANGNHPNVWYSRPAILASLPRNYASSQPSSLSNKMTPYIPSSQSSALSVETPKTSTVSVPHAAPTHALKSVVSSSATMQAHNATTPIVLTSPTTGSPKKANPFAFEVHQKSAELPAAVMATDSPSTLPSTSKTTLPLQAAAPHLTASARLIAQKQSSTAGQMTQIVKKGTGVARSDHKKEWVPPSLELEALVDPTRAIVDASVNRMSLVVDLMGRPKPQTAKQTTGLRSSVSVNEPTPSIRIGVQTMWPEDLEQPEIGLLKSIPAIPRILEKTTLKQPVKDDIKHMPAATVSQRKTLPGRPNSSPRPNLVPLPKPSIMKIGIQKAEELEKQMVASTVPLESNRNKTLRNEKKVEKTSFILAKAASSMTTEIAATAALHRTSIIEKQQKPPVAAYMSNNGNVQNARLVRIVPKRVPARNLDIPSTSVDISEQWEKSVYGTLASCTQTIKRMVHRRSETFSNVPLDMTYVMAEFLKPAIASLDEIEKLESCSHQEELKRAANVLMDRVAKQEEDQYSTDHLPTVKLARALATFAEKFNRMAANFSPHESCLNYNTGEDPSSSAALDGSTAESQQLPPIRTHVDDDGILRVDDDDDEMEEFIIIDDDGNARREGDKDWRNEEREERDRRETADGEKAMKRKKPIWDVPEEDEILHLKNRKRAKPLNPVEVREEAMWEKAEEYTGDSTILSRQILRSYLENASMNLARKEKITKKCGSNSRNRHSEMYMMRICTYCKEEQENELALVEHMRRNHYEQWKKFAPIQCKWQPHCDYRTTQPFFMEDHARRCHDDLYLSWLIEDRMQLGGSICTFCKVRISNVYHLREHLEERHQHSIVASFKHHVPILGCASCSFSAFWAADVYEHWRARPSCRGRLVLRPLPKKLHHVNDILLKHDSLPTIVLWPVPRNSTITRNGNGKDMILSATAIAPSEKAQEGETQKTDPQREDKVSEQTTVQSSSDCDSPHEYHQKHAELEESMIDNTATTSLTIAGTSTVNSPGNDGCEENEVQYEDEEDEEYEEMESGLVIMDDIEEEVDVEGFDE